jgi:hypothetical protein
MGVEDIRFRIYWFELVAASGGGRLRDCGVVLIRRRKALAMVVGNYRTGDRSSGLRSRLAQSHHILQAFAASSITE